MKLNIKNSKTLVENYQNGLLPQRNDKSAFYQDSSCRSNLSNFSLSSENRRILRKTEEFTFIKSDIFFNLDIQKKIYSWVKELGWEFPTSSVKNIFTNHIFNELYQWKLGDETIAYSVCYSSAEISHIAYVFYDPKFSHSDLPIRLVLQYVIDSYQNGIKFCYLGRFSNYKRNMPGFENFINGHWSK